eukprot:6097356-Pyramimonas_sp.AAC.1
MARAHPVFVPSPLLPTPASSCSSPFRPPPSRPQTSGEEEDGRGGGGGGGDGGGGGSNFEHRGSPFED